jgi:hypothetical protein
MKSNLKPTPLFAQLKQEINTPALSIREIPIARFDLPYQSLFLKSAEETYIIEICEIFATTSRYEVSVNGRQFDSFERTEILMYSEEVLVTITLDHELLLPIANRCMGESPWSFTVRAQSRDGRQFQEDRLLFTLPDFNADSRSPELHHFKQLLDPKSDTELKPLEIFAQVVISKFWKEKGNFDVYLSEGDTKPAFTV